jgi:L-rhamnose mutarotase
MANEIYHRSNWGNAVNDIAWGDVYEKFDATNEMFVRSDNYENSNETDKLMADIYPKPSILLTPTAYDNGSLHSVKPVLSPFADFDFTRGSSATRVNEQGLIEDVQILSGELVQNGDFEQIGSELVTNGDFSTSGTPNTSSWSLGWYSNTNNVIISDGKLTMTNSASESDARVYATNGTSSNNILTTNKFYKLQYDIVSNNGVTDFRYYSEAGAFISVPSVEVGSYTIYIRNTSNSLFLFQNRTSNSSISIDNVSVKEVGQNWTVANEDTNNYVEFDQAEGTVRLKFLNTSPITTLSSATQYLSGKKYKLTVDVKEVVSGGIKIDAAGVSQTYNSVGVQEAIIEPISNSAISFYRATANVDITLNSVSLIEITDDTDLPRIDYTSGFGSLLLEPQRTNLLTYSEDFGDSDWTKANVNINTNTVLAPDGTITADEQIETTGNATHLSFQNTTVSNAATVSLSLFVKRKNTRYCILLENATGKRIGFNFDTGLIEFKSSNIETFVEQFTDGWYRIGFTCTVPSTSAIFRVYNTPDGTTISYTGDDVSGFYLWGAQLEAGDYATSYIPTNGSTVTRSADVANNSGNADLINSTEGVLYAEISALADDQTFRLLSLSDGTSNNRVYIGLGTVSNQITASISSGGTLQALMNNTVTDTTTYNKIALKYKLNDVSLYVNGTEVATDTSATMPTLTSLQFTSGVTSSVFYGNVKCVAVFKEALTDAELQQLTS